MWEFELVRWRNKIYRERGGPVKLRIQAIEEIDRALEYLKQADREGRLLPDAVWGAWKN